MALLASGKTGGTGEDPPGNWGFRAPEEGGTQVASSSSAHLKKGKLGRASKSMALLTFQHSIISPMPDEKRITHDLQKRVRECV